MQAIEELNKAKAHLEKARELLPSPPASLRESLVLGTLDFVVPAVRNATRLLKQQKEEKVE